ncbi:centrosomal protein of 135 kDa isoform X1 [Brienomyrus brachyistius]|uniref:centrosomal protein of 135 kDa isoform X1 n=2 Tax=Brienomyrus brachyistius TaxID=42636 RepID=UPI0020B3C5AA|nr:centrosomal protein of 135 kDa isoform X1 [Brienomyrus brachyistius]
MSTNTERKLANLRKRLDQLGYRQPLGSESFPLVEKLFSDLVHTTESLRNAKLSVGKTEKDTQHLDTVLEPYRVENARLVKENNELHLDLLKMKEDKDRVCRELKSQIRKLEHEATDLKFLNNQYVHKVHSMEKADKAKMERIQQLQEKNMHAVVQTPGGRKRTIPFRRQRMQIDDLIPPSNSRLLPVAQPEDPYVADLLLVADERIQELQRDVTRLKMELDRAQDGIKHLNLQVEERDQEVERLARALDGGRPHDVITLEAQNVSNEKLIAHLNLQIEYLQDANAALKQQLQGHKQTASSEVTNLNNQNQELCQELSHIDQLARQLQRDKDLVLATADQELLEAKKEMLWQHRQIEDLKDVVSKLRKDLAESEDDREELRSRLAEMGEENEKTKTSMNFLEEQKRRLQEKVEKMTDTEKELVLELEQMRIQHGVCRKERSPSRLDAFVRSLEEDRDFYKQEAERHQWAGQRGVAVSPGGGVAKSPRRGGRARSPGKGGASTNEELQRAVQERDELQLVLVDVEKHMQDIQARVRMLTAERDLLISQNQQAQEELLRLHREVGRPPVEKENVDTELQRMAMERERIQEQLKVVLSNKEEEERTMQNLRNTIQALEDERSALRSQVSMVREKQASLEEELKSRVTALVQMGEEAAQTRAEADALRLLQEQMEQTLSDSQQRLSLKKNELMVAHHKIRTLEEKIGEQVQQNSSKRDQLTAVQRTVSALDREKDALQAEVDQKTESIVVLQEEIVSKEKTLAEVRITVTDMEASLEKLQAALRGREREIGSLRRQLDAAQEELAVVVKEREVILKENRRLQDDLATMTGENQTVHTELEEAMHQKDELKMRVHSYIAEVARVESMMALKEQENRDILERFRTAHSQAEDWEAKLQQVEGLNSSIRLELLATDTERRHLRERVAHLEREIQEHLNAQQAYEMQASSLVKSLSRLEEELQAAHAGKAAALADLASVRELCVKLDSSKEATARKLASKSMELERLVAELEDVRSEADLLRKRLSDEHQNVKNLELLLSNERQKEFQTQLGSSEKEAEVRTLRDRLALADGRTAGYVKEVSQLRAKVSQMQAELDMLKRQLTTERFERERAVQEMRRQALSSSTLRSSSPLSSSLGPHRLSSEHSTLRTSNSTEKVNKSLEKNGSLSIRDNQESI